MLGLRSVDMSNPLALAFMVLLFAVGMMLLPACPHLSGAECDHPCCTSEGRSRMHQRLVRRLTSCGQAAVGTPSVSLENAAVRATGTPWSVACVDPLVEVPRLRI